MRFPIHAFTCVCIVRRAHGPGTRGSTSSTLGWFGVATGVVRRSFVHALAAAGHDVAFNIKVKSVGRTALQRHMWEEDMSAPLIRRQLMGYKYILCLEGNDVATSLKWQMAHNSLIFMPTPTKESWLMEGLLRPWVHYAPLDSPHEAADRLRWARANDAECQRIVANANAWVESLQNDVEWWQLPAMLNAAAQHRTFGE